MPHRKSASDTDSTLAAKLHSHPRWLQVVFGILIMFAVIGLPAFIIGMAGGWMDLAIAVNAVLAFLALTKLMEYIVTEAAKQLL